jgi:hypothetical protein
MGRKRLTPEGYDEKAANRERMRARRKAERDVVIPAVVDPARKERCRRDLVLYAKTYIAPYLSLPFSPVHIEILRSIQQRILYGGSNALAAPRGFGKDQLLIIACLWAVSYGHRRYIAYFCPSMSMSKARLRWLKFLVETNPLIAEDFPEIVVPIADLEGAAQKGPTQTVGGERTRIHWGTDLIIFPNVPGSDSALSVVQPGGLDSSNRGFNEMGKRPDFVIISDLESNEVARSETQKETYEETVENTLGGLVGPGETLSMFMLCTIFMKGALSEKYTDPTQKPAWNGRRYKALVDMPERMDLWQEYMELRRESQSTGKDPYGRAAHTFYVKHRDEMDAGAVVLWPEWYVKQTMEDGLPQEVSAIQGIFNKWCDKGDKYFYCELQNDPQDDQNKLADLTPKLVTERLHGYPQGIVPFNCTKVVCGVDIGKAEIHFVVRAYAPDGSPFGIDYGRIEVPRLLELDTGGIEDLDQIQDDSARDKAIEKRLLASLRQLRDMFRLHGYVDSEGNRRDVDLVLVDSGGPKAFQDAVYQFCHESGKRYQATKGEGTGRNMKKFVVQEPNKKTRVSSTHWYKRPRADRRGYLYHFDADYYKEYVHNRFLQAPGETGCATLWGNEPRAHRLYGKHICGEVYDVEKGKWDVVGPNHFLDATVLSELAASLLGIRLRMDVTPVALAVDEDVVKGADVTASRQGRKNRSAVKAPAGQGRTMKYRKGAW